MERYLRICGQIEIAVGAIYRGLADSVVCTQRQRETWRQLAGEEEEHARQVRIAAGYLPVNCRPVAPSSRQRAELLLIRAHMVLMGMTGLPPAADEALHLGLRLEEEFREIHALGARESEYGPMRTAFEGLVREDERHLERLQASLAEQSRSEDCRFNRIPGTGFRRL